MKGFHSDLQCKFDLRAAHVFNLTRTATTSFNGVGGLTVLWLARKLRLLFSHQPLPKVIILEIGTNDLGSHSPEVVIGDLLDLVELLQSVYSSTAAGVHLCKVLPRRHRSVSFPHEELNTRATTFKKMLTRFLTINRRSLCGNIWKCSTLPVESFCLTASNSTVIGSIVFVGATGVPFWKGSLCFPIRLVLFRLSLWEASMPRP